MLSGSGLDDAVRDRQLESTAELSCRQRKPGVEIHDLPARPQGGRLNGLSLPVFAQGQLEHPKDGDRRHHKRAFVWTLQGAKNCFSVVLSAEKYERLQRLDEACAPSLAELLLRMPQDDEPVERLPLEPREFPYA